KNEVDAFDLLLLSELLAVTDQRLTAAQRVSVLPGRLRTTFFNRASWFVTTIALQKQLRAFATAKATHSISIPSQLFASGLLPPTHRGPEKFTGCASANPSSFGLIHLPLANCRLPIFNRRSLQSAIGNRKSAMT